VITTGVAVGVFVGVAGMGLGVNVAAAVATMIGVALAWGGIAVSVEFTAWSTVSWLGAQAVNTRTSVSPAATTENDWQFLMVASLHSLYALPLLFVSLEISGWRAGARLRKRHDGQHRHVV
jgi:hypothetical protein